MHASPILMPSSLYMTKKNNTYMYKTMSESIYDNLLPCTDHLDSIKLILVFFAPILVSRKFTNPHVWQGLLCQAWVSGHGWVISALSLWVSICRSRLLSRSRLLNFLVEVPSPFPCCHAWITDSKKWQSRGIMIDSSNILRWMSLNNMILC